MTLIALVNFDTRVCWKGGVHNGHSMAFVRLNGFDRSICTLFALFCVVDREFGSDVRNWLRRDSPTPRIERKALAIFYTAHAQGKKTLLIIFLGLATYRIDSVFSRIRRRAQGCGNAISSDRNFSASAPLCVYLLNLLYDTVCIYQFRPVYHLSK